MALKDDYQKIDALSPLEKSQQVQKITKEKTNFGYDNIKDILQDLQNEIDELTEEIDVHHINNNNIQRIFEELGDVVFVIGNLANKYSISSNDALEHSIKEFERRIIYCEENYHGDLKNASNDEIIKLWKEAKKAKE